MVPLLSPVRRSTVELGRAFELHCLRFLNRQLYMDLTQVGGAGDGGVDLRGWWLVPTAGPSSSRHTPQSVTPQGMQGMQELRRLRVLAQCKAERKALGPRTVRELEGVMAHQRGMAVPVFSFLPLRQVGDARNQCGSKLSWRV